jgi:hypothetical protein
MEISAEGMGVGAEEQDAGRRMMEGVRFMEIFITEC